MFLFMERGRHSFRTNPFIVLTANMNRKQSLVKLINEENTSPLNSTTPI